MGRGGGGGEMQNKSKVSQFQLIFQSDSDYLLFKGLVVLLPEFFPKPCPGVQEACTSHPINFLNNLNYLLVQYRFRKAEFT